MLGSAPHIDWKEALESVARIGGVCAAIGALLTLMKGGKKQFMDGLTGFWQIVVVVTAPLHLPWTFWRWARKQVERAEQVDARLSAVEKKFEAVESAVTYIKDEHTANGWGSSKDLLTLLFGFYKQTMREKPYPMFMCDGDGRNIVVSDAYLELVEVERETDILELDWRQFAHQEDLGPYMAAFIAAAKNRSAFGGSIRLISRNGNPRGEWVVAAHSLLKHQDQRLVYFGVLRPVDATARAVAEGLSFTYPL